MEVPKAPDLSSAQASVSAAGKHAGDYLSSWARWAGEKRKVGWGKSPSTQNVPTTSSSRQPEKPTHKADVSTSTIELELGKKSFEEEIFQAEQFRDSPDLQNLRPKKATVDVEGVSGSDSAEIASSMSKNPQTLDPKQPSGESSSMASSATEPTRANR